MVPINIAGMKQKEQILQWSIFVILSEFLWSYLPYLINHHKHLNDSLQATWQQIDCTNSNFPVALWPSEGHGQGHSNWNHIVKFSSVQHHTKIERSCFTSDPMQVNIKGILKKKDSFLPWLKKKINYVK